jgi:UDP:flavonoid glycosyltransferase YjiC (YdhE family)
MFITHGGFDGVQEALIAGVPMLLFPQMQEQALNTARVCELDAGLRLRRATPGQITAKTDLILTDRRFRDAAVRAGTELRSAVDLDGAVTAVLSARGAHL